MKDEFDNIYGVMTPYISKHFRSYYYPSYQFTDEVLSMLVDSDCTVNNVTLYDISSILTLLTDNEEFNKMYMEVLFMFIIDPDEMDSISTNGMMEEFSCGIFESLIGSNIYKRYLNYFNIHLAFKIIKLLYKLIIKDGIDAHVIGWYKNDKYTIGVMYV